MNLADVERELRRLGVPEGAYAFVPRRGDEQYLLYEEPRGTWVVSFVERGTETFREEFSSEHGACSRFLERIKSDRGVPRRPR
ncbi:MAG TPA: hypothetical protein VFF69_12420 [Phycisphaerales bacterium]|nr:hypothetical protein [Phycisphaerales bacterium]